MNRIVRECLERIKEGIVDNIRKNGQWATGKTAASMQIEETDGNGGRLVGRADFHSLETGTRPEAPKPANFTNLIEEWMRAKGIQPNNGDYRGAAYAIARHIHLYGTRLFNEGGRKDTYSNVIDAEVERLKAELSFEIKQRIINDIKELN